MKIRTLAALVAGMGAASLATAAAAQTLGFGSTPGGGWTNSSATAISKVVVEHTKLKMRVQPRAASR